MEKEFVCELVLNLYANSFISGEIVLDAGDNVENLFFIMSGQLAICDPT